MPRFHNLGHRDAPFPKENRDENTIEARRAAVGFVLTATHCPTGKGWLISQEGTAGPELRRVGRAGGAGLAA